MVHLGFNSIIRSLCITISRSLLLLFSEHEESEPADLQGTLHGW